MKTIAFCQPAIRNGPANSFAIDTQHTEIDLQDPIHDRNLEGVDGQRVEPLTAPVPDDD